MFPPGGGLAINQLLKMKARGQISLAEFLELTKEVEGFEEERPVELDADEDAAGHAADDEGGGERQQEEQQQEEGGSSGDVEEEDVDDEDDDEDDEISTADLLVYLFLAAGASAIGSAIMTYAHVTGLYPPIVTKLAGSASQAFGGLFGGGGSSYMPAAGGGAFAGAPPAAGMSAAPPDWRWAQPPPAEQLRAPSAANPGGGTSPRAPSQSYGGL